MIAVGRIGRLFGTEGGVMITLYTTFPDDFQMKEPLFIRVDELAVPLFCSSFERRGQSSAVVQFDDIDTERRAEEWLVGREIFVEEQEQDDDGAKDGQPVAKEAPEEISRHVQLYSRLGSSNRYDRSVSRLITANVAAKRSRAACSTG